jgi:choline dehydrogenase-like flavoprotein
MRVIEQIDSVSQLTADVCLVGGGPVGLCLAHDLCRRGLSVVLFESGLRRPNRTQQALSDATIVSERWHAPMSLAVCRALGGTSWLWGGRCVPMDPLDFEARSYLPDSGWRISEADVAPYYAGAARLLGCGPAVFSAEADIAEPLEDRSLRIDRLERWTNEPNTARQPFLKTAPDSLTIVLGATVVDLEFDLGAERVLGAVIASKGRREAFRSAKAFVIACGGLETARLLLNVQARLPRLFGGEQGALGRYYMGHLSGRIADIQFSDPKMGRLFDYHADRHSMTRRRLTLSRSIQIAGQIPNVSFYPENLRMADPRHGSGMLSAAFLMLSIPALGRRFMAEAVRRAQVGNETRYQSHLRNIVVDLPATAAAFFQIAHQRFVMKRRKPMFFMTSRDGRYPLHFHAEHLPNRESRVSLTSETDALGLRRLAVDLRFSARDADGINRAHVRLDELLQTKHMGALAFRIPEDQHTSDILDQATDGFHQMGLTRMGANPNDGVVDDNCRVFGVTNLFLAGSSVNRTSGQANPTFSAVALALRLSAHLGGLVKSGTPMASS